MALPRVGAKPWTGDLDGMIKRRVIRVLVPYSKTYYFVDRAIQRGLTYDVTRLFEQDLNTKLKTGHIRVNVICHPDLPRRDDPGLAGGAWGHRHAGNLTITPERLKKVDFTYPTARNAREIVVTGPGAQPIRDRGGPGREGSLHSQVVELLREHRAAQRGARQGEEGAR